MADAAALMRALEMLPQRFAGPGGVAGVVQAGEVVARVAWGFADLTAALPMTTDTPLPVCSITKQFTCAALLARLGAPEVLDPGLPALLPRLEGPPPTVRQLCHNQSGLRDSWAMTVVEGARAEQVFPPEVALPLMAAMRRGHFAPGHGYSYSNGNFRLISALLQDATGEGLETLFRRHLWEPAGMARACLAPDTRQPPEGVIGYEGNEALGFRPADTAIWWEGDAGMAASLNDMLAWECWIDATRDEAAGIYRQMSAPVAFADGRPARYGFGLAQDSVAGVAVSGHGGALRGFRAHRMHAAAHRLSVVVMFNHEAAAKEAAGFLLRAALGQPAPAAPPAPVDWAGHWLCPQTGLLARIEATGGPARLFFATGAEDLWPSGRGLANAETEVWREGGRLAMHRHRDNLRTVMDPVHPGGTVSPEDIAGRYLCTETGSRIEIAAAGAAAFARFHGRLGTGRMEPMVPVAPDLWLIRTRRAMDAPAPGDWTLQLRRDGRRVRGATLGCWLARGLDFARV